jgi:tyrosinase
MAAFDELQAQANALMGSAASPGVAVTQALVEDDPGAPFSPFVPAQAEEAVRLAEGLAELADDVGGEAGVQAALARARELAEEYPPQLVQHALHLFIVHHPEGSRLSIPAILPVLEGGPAVVTADLEETKREAALDYLRQDPLANEHHRHWHAVYPTSGWRGRLQDRQGELFIYMHQQMLARYDAERRAVGLEPVVPFDDYRAPIGEGFGDRPPDQPLVDVDIPAQIELSVAELERQRDAIFGAVADGTFGTDDLIESLDALGRAEEPQRGGEFDWHHGAGHVSCGWVMAPDGNGEMGLIGSTRTAIQDPFFWRWHRHVDNLGFQVQEQFEPHSFDDAPALMLRDDGDPSGGDLIVCFEDQMPDDARVDEAAATAWARETFAGDHFDEPADGEVSTDTLETSMTETPFDPDDPDTVPVRHLTHRPFCVVVRVRSEEPERKRVTVRLFLAPADAASDRRAWIELDKFEADLEPGDRTAFCRPMRFSSVVRKPTTPEPVFVQPPAASRREQYCRCGWPYHLLVPRGTEEGMPFRLAAIVTDFALDNITGDPECGSLSFCGALDEDFPDTREMGYPFNRPFGATEIDAVLRGQDSMAVRDLTVRHSPDD